MTARERAVEAIREAIEDRSGTPELAMQRLEAAGLRVIEGDLVAAACHELRSLLEEFHAARPDRESAVLQRAELTPTDLTARLNRLAALERGETPA